MGISKAPHLFSEAPLFPPRKEKMCAVVNFDMIYVIRRLMLEFFNALCILAKHLECLL